MALETGTYISSLNSANPVGPSDPKSQGDDHIRLIKATLLATFPNITGVVTASHSELSILVGVTATATELNKLAGLTATTTELNKLAGLATTKADLGTIEGASGILDVDGTDGLTVTGRVTITAQPAFFASLSADDSSAGVIVFDNQITDAAGNYNPANGQFAAPVTGLYSVNCTLTPAATGGAVNAYIQVNSGTKYPVYSGAVTGDFACASRTVVLALTAGDVVDVTLVSGGAKGDTADGTWSTFSGHLI